MFCEKLASTASDDVVVYCELIGQCRTIQTGCLTTIYCQLVREGGKKERGGGGRWRRRAGATSISQELVVVIR